MSDNIRCDECLKDLRITADSLENNKNQYADAQDSYENNNINVLFLEDQTMKLRQKLEAKALELSIAKDSIFVEQHRLEFYHGCKPGLCIR
jgi:hypothetical protein